MADKTTDSTQPESTAETEDLSVFIPGEDRGISKEPIDRDDPPVADLARELPPEVKDAVRREGTWEGDAGRHDGDDAQDSSGELSGAENDRDAGT
ncbi:hypothetical protein [Roseobacter litoralis]|uniref:Uncharacterized protein n=1 Tax=Roseobacter litoralis (strain ATCC 49566 / DSM 6996 / JCM 21268 / NBRC 15278 / OCh 149) TaxID=391595 RepID=F7ZJ52_ROSLO|nr:hypothetical protein [Roseobacter litoralis]AEI96297.1 hypothetical protein RLO149_c044060 [Roseobacter litoralis Och 149]